MQGISFFGVAVPPQRLSSPIPRCTKINHSIQCKKNDLTEAEIPKSLSPPSSQRPPPYKTSSTPSQDTSRPLPLKSQSHQIPQKYNSYPQKHRYQQRPPSTPPPPDHATQSTKLFSSFGDVITPRWVHELTQKLAPFLVDADANTPINPKIASYVLSIVPPPPTPPMMAGAIDDDDSDEELDIGGDGEQNDSTSGSRNDIVDTTDSSDSLHSSSTPGKSLSSSSKHSSPSSRVIQQQAYDNELAAILDYYKQAPEIDVPIQEGNQHTTADTVPMTNALDVTARSSRAVKIGTGVIASQGQKEWGRARMSGRTLKSLLKLLVDTVSPDAAYVFYTILDQSQMSLPESSPYPTRSSKVVCSFIHRLMSSNSVVLAHKVLLHAALCGEFPEKASWVEGWKAAANGGRPDLIQGIIHQMRESGRDPGVHAYIGWMLSHCAQGKTQAAIKIYKEMMLNLQVNGAGDNEDAIRALTEILSSAMSASSISTTASSGSAISISISNNESIPSPPRNGKANKSAAFVAQDEQQRLVDDRAVDDALGMLDSIIQEFKRNKTFEMYHEYLWQGALSGLMKRRNFSQNMLNGIATRMQQEQCAISASVFEQILSSPQHINDISGHAAFTTFKKFRKENLIREIQNAKKTMDYEFSSLNMHKVFESYLGPAPGSIPPLPRHAHTETFHVLLQPGAGDKDQEQQQQQSHKKSMHNNNKGNSTGTTATAVVPHEDKKKLTALYSSLMSTTQRHRCVIQVLELFEMLHHDGLRPTRAIMSRACAAMSYAKNSDASYRLYCYALELGMDLDEFMYRHFIVALGADHDIKQRWPIVMHLLHRMHIEIPHLTGTNVHTTLAVFVGKAGYLDGLMEMYALMLQDGIMPTTVTWNAFITACLRCGHPQKGFSFEKAMHTMKVPLDAATYSSLLSCCSSLKDASRAQELWERMLEDGLRPDRIACSSYMWAVVCGGKPELAIDLFEEWQESGEIPTMTKTMRQRSATAGALLLKHPRSSDRHQQQRKQGNGAGTASNAKQQLERDTSINNKAKSSQPTFEELCRALARRGKWTESRQALQLQHWMRNHGVDPSTLLIDDLNSLAARDKGKWSMAARLVSSVAPVPVVALPPDAPATCFALTAYGQLGRHKEAQALAEKLMEMDMPAETVIYTSALGACGEAGAAHAALHLLSRARAAGVVPEPQGYTAAISACLPGGHADLALRVLCMIQEDGHRPNEIMLNALLGVCCSAMDVDTALDIFHKLESEWGIVPGNIAYNTVEETLSRVGRYADALVFLCVARAQGFIDPGILSGIQGIWSSSGSNSLDLHGLTVPVAQAVTRGWLLSLKRRIMKNSPLSSSQQKDRKQKGKRTVTSREKSDLHSKQQSESAPTTAMSMPRLYTIITGRGKGSKDGVAKLRPAISSMFMNELGNSLQCAQAAENPGVLIISAERFESWLVSPQTNLGLGSKDIENKLWNLFSEKVRATPNILKDIR